MVVRTAKRGTQAGNSFLGYATYLVFKGTREIEAWVWHGTFRPAKLGLTITPNPRGLIFTGFPK